MYRKSKKLLAWALVVSMILTQMIFTNVALAAGSNRLSGLNRYETALRVSQSGWAAGSTQYAVLAYGEDFPDALSAAPLAKKFNAPILLTDKDALSAGVLEEINRIGATNVFIVGGTGVVSAAVENALTAAGKTVTRLAGASRYETALKVAEQVGASDTVVVADGENYPDALSIAPIAAAKGWPILLTGTNAMDAAVKAYIGSKKAFVVGGTGAVSDAVFNGLSGAERVFGADRYATNVAVMTKFASDLDFNKVFLATGENFADALAGAAYAAKVNAPVVLVGASMPAATESFIDSKVTSATEVIALGGTAVVPESAVTAVGGGTQDLSISAIAVTTQDGRNVKITFNRPVAPIKKSDISIVQKSSQSMVGVDSVEMSADNTSVAVQLQEETSDATATITGYIKQLEAYTFTIKADGRTLIQDYTRPGYLEARVIDFDKDNGTITALDEYGQTSDLTVLADVNMDLFDVVGRTVNVWFNKDYEVTKFTLEDETVKYDAVEFFPDLTSDQVKLQTEGKKYDLAKTTNDNELKNLQIYVDGVEGYYYDADAAVDETDVTGGVAKDASKKWDFAKIVYDKNGDISFLDIYEWDNAEVVEKVDGTIVYGYGDELDAEDYLITKNGKTIALTDLKQGDILYYNTDEEIAEVYNNSFSGDIEEIFEDRLTIGGKDMKVAVGDMPINAKYINEDGDIDSLPTGDDLKDLAETYQDAGEVTVFLNRYGKMVYLAGDIADLVKTTHYDFVTADTVEYSARNKWFYNVDTFTTDSQEIDYDIDKEDVDGSTGDDTLIGTDGETPATMVGTEYDPVTGAVTTDGSVMKGDVVKVKIDKDGALSEVQLLNTEVVDAITTDGTPATTGQFETVDDYISGKSIDKDVPVYLVEDYTDDTDDIDVTTYGELTFDYINKGTFWYDENDKVVAITVEDSDRKDDTTDYFSMATDEEVKVSGKDNEYKLPVVFKGAKTGLFTEENVEIYRYDGTNFVAYADDPVGTPNGKTAYQKFAAAVAKGTMLKLAVDDKNVVTKVYVLEHADFTTEGVIDSINTSDREIELDTLTAAQNPLKLGEAAKVVYYDKQDGAVIKITDLKAGDKVKVARVADGSKFIEVVYRTLKK